MRTNRPSYASAPAGSSRALDQKPKPRRPKKEWNQLLLTLFFVVLPVIGLLAIFFQPVRWIFMVLTVACLAVMWLVRAFLFPGRMIIMAVYGLLLVITLVTALSAQNTSALPSQSPFAQVQPTLVPTQVPGYMLATQSPIADGLMDDLQHVGMTGGSEDQSGQDLGLSEAGATGYTAAVKSEAEIALENFMEKWRKGIIADMVMHTPPSWRDAQADSAEKQLFWKFKQKPLIDWRQMAAPTGTDASTARTITVEADITYSGETRTYQYDAVILYEGSAWYVDPNSLSSGILVEQSTPTPDPNTTPTPSPEPTPTPKPNSKTKLYYNKDGGKYYHADPECYTVAKEFLPLASFTYGNINKSPYTRLVPCEKCQAPSR